MSDQPKSFTFASVKFAVLIAALAALGALAWRYNVPLETLRTYVSRVPSALRYPAFVGLFTLVSVAPVPARDVVKLTGAILFGGWISGVLIYLGEMGAVAAAWVLGRALGKDFVDQLAAGRFSGLEKKIRGATWGQIAILRIIPATPYRFLNYLAPVTEVGAKPYFLGCVVGTLPRTMFFQLIFGGVSDRLAERGTTTFQVFAVSIGFAVFALGYFAWKATRRSGDG